jgi:hypothetical protein
MKVRLRRVRTAADVSEGRSGPLGAERDFRVEPARELTVMVGREDRSSESWQRTNPASPTTATPRAARGASPPGFTSSGHSACITIPKLLIAAHKTYHITAEVRSGTRGKVINHAAARATNAPSVRSKAPTIVTPSPTVTG